METKSNLTLGLVLGLIAGLVIGTAGLYFYLDKTGKTFNDGYAFAKERLAQNFPQFNIPEDQVLKSLDGTSLYITGNVLSMKINLIDPLSSPDLDIRNVIIDNNTRIVIAKLKSQDVYQKEVNEYLKQIQKFAETGKGEVPTSVDQYERNIGSKGDIGNTQITVVSDENIRDQKTFIATEIIAYKV